MSKILNVAARVIFDNKGVPTPEIEIQTVCGTFRASAPSQTSFSDQDFVELRDYDKSWGGMGVQKCIEMLRSKVKTALGQIDLTTIEKVDQLLVEIDDSSAKRLNSLGTNAALPTSVVCLQAISAYNRQPVFKYISNLLNIQPRIPQLAISLISAGAQCGEAFFKDLYVVSL